MKRSNLYLKIPLAFLFAAALNIGAQSRINFHGQNLFLSGSNVAWVNFADDIGPNPSTPQVSSFQSYFKSVSQAGGNSIRFWLHTTGTKTPQFNQQGFVTAPGQNTIDDMKTILDIAWQNNVGMILSLWSFDMMRKTIGQTYLNRNRLMLTDTLYTRAYISNCLIPMVRELKNHPAIISWEVFNEPEGMSKEFGWPDITTADIDMVYIQRFINLVAGAIHREDPNAKVTNGSWGFPAMTDVFTIGKKMPVEIFAGMTPGEIAGTEKYFARKYGVSLNAGQIAENFNALLGANKNYYRDDRLIAAGGDLKGTLDFYTVHYYSWAGTAMSPFHNPYSYWNLDKALAVAEFYVQDTFNKNYDELYRILIETGYAGALDWGWDNSTYSSNARKNMRDLYENYPYDVVLNPKSGVIYSFRSSAAVIEKGDSVLLKWKTAQGSSVTLNNEAVPIYGERYVKPLEPTFYELRASGQLSSTQKILIEVLPSGKILYFKALSELVGPGESTTLSWETSRGSVVTLNGQLVPEDGSMIVSPVDNPTPYVLRAVGDIIDSSVVIISIVPANQVNRALNKSATASTSYSSSAEHQPQNGIDGNFFTSWMSEYSDMQWYEIDLGEDIDIGKIDIYWGADYATKYRIGVAKVKPNYQIIKTITAGTGMYESFSDLKVTGRYLRIVLDKRATAKGYNIIEIEVYGKLSNSTAIGEPGNGLPANFELYQNYPNPFNPSTRIRYAIPYSGKVRIKIYDLLGKEISTLVDEYKNAGEYEIEFGANNLASGVYFYRLEAGSRVITKKLLIIR